MWKVCDLVLDTFGWSFKGGPRPVASASLRSYWKCTFLGPSANLLIQKLWGWGPSSPYVSWGVDVVLGMKEILSWLLLFSQGNWKDIRWAWGLGTSCWRLEETEKVWSIISVIQENGRVRDVGNTMRAPGNIKYPLRFTVMCLHWDSPFDCVVSPAMSSWSWQDKRQIWRRNTWIKRLLSYTCELYK